MYLKILIFLFLPFTLFSEETIIQKQLASHNDMTVKMKYVNSKDALLNWIQNFTNTTKLNVNLNIYNDYKEMFTDYDNNKIDILVFSPYSYIHNKDNIRKNSTNFWFMKKDRKYNFHKKYLIVNNSINNLSDLKDTKIMINKANKISEMFLEKIYLEKVKKSAKKILKNVEFVNNKSILLKTYFGVYKASIVDSYEYDTMLELNPTIIKKIKILEESPRIFNGMITSFHKNNTAKDMENYKEILNQVLKDKGKLELFNLLKIKSVESNDNISVNLNYLENFYNDYLKAKKKYDK